MAIVAAPITVQVESTMNAQIRWQRLFLLVTSVLMVVMMAMLASCSAVQETEPVQEPAESSAVAEAASPVEVTEAFFNWYVDAWEAVFRGEREGSTAGLYHESPALTEALMEKLDGNSGQGADPVLFAQDLPQQISVEAWEESENSACVIVHETWSGGSNVDLTVDLVRQGGAWMLNDIRAGSPATPQGATQLFYSWYLAYIGQGETRRNPLVDAAYRESDLLSPAFVEKVDGILAEAQGAAYDPILLAQDVPVGIEILETAEEGDEATVTVARHFGGNPEGYPMQVHLQKQNDRWLITDVTMDGQWPAMMPEEVVQAFYAEWKEAFTGAMRGEGGSPLAEKAYRRSRFLTPALMDKVEGIVSGFEQGGYDPFFCAQDVPGTITVDGVTLEGNRATAQVSTDFSGHGFEVVLELSGAAAWLIDDVICAPPGQAGSPVEAVESFYSWYLAYIGDPAGDDFRNPLVDRAYRQAPHVSEAFVEEMDALLEQEIEEFGGIHADPILQAQDFPAGFEVVAPGPAEEIVTVNLFFGETVHPVQVRVVQKDGQWLVDGIIPRGSTLPVEGAPGAARPIADASGWQTFVDEDYGFSFRLPPDWVADPMDMGAPGMPEDWPVPVGYALMSQAVAEALAAQSSPPDPNAPPVVIPFLLEVVIGGQAAFDRVYVPPVERETAIYNGYEVLVERDAEEYTMVRYVFRHRQDEQMWVVFSDALSEFPGREAQAAEVEGILPAILESFSFGQ